MNPKTRGFIANMGFLGVYTSLYDYHPEAEGELELREGNLLYLLESSEEDDWWKVKKKADREDEDEPEGLVPNNYIEEVRKDMLLLSSLQWLSLLAAGCLPGWLCDCERTQPNTDGVVEGGGYHGSCRCQTSGHAEEMGVHYEWYMDRAC